VPIDFEDRFVDLAELVTKPLPEFDGRTFCEQTAYSVYKFHRTNYCGNRDDIAQSVVVGLLEWAKTQPDQTRLLYSAVQKVAQKAIEVEVAKNCYWDRDGYGGGPSGPSDLDDDGNLLPWNPAEADDLVSDERAKRLTSAILAINSTVGELAGYVVAARLLHDLPFTEIKRRLNLNDRHLADRHTRRLLGYPTHYHGSHTVEQLEVIFDTAIRTIRDKFAHRDWPDIKRLFTRSEFRSLRSELREELRTGT